MSLARTIRRGAFLKARLGVNGTQNDARSFGTVGAACLVRASGMAVLLHAAADAAKSGCRAFLYQP
jgi:hypothetical protein